MFLMGRNLMNEDLIVKIFLVLAFCYILGHVIVLISR